MIRVTISGASDYISLGMSLAQGKSALLENDLRATIQALGWRDNDRYLPLNGGISCVASRYQTEPHAASPKFPGKDARKFN
jgi:hypothetical protein